MKQKINFRHKDSDKENQIRQPKISSFNTGGETKINHEVECLKVEVVKESSNLYKSPKWCSGPSQINTPTGTRYSSREEAIHDESISSSETSKHRATRDRNGVFTPDSEYDKSSIREKMAPLLKGNTADEVIRNLVNSNPDIEEMVESYSHVKDRF